jgi:hypothetical protein
MPSGGTVSPSSTNDITDLAVGTLNGGDELVVQLVRPRMRAAERTLKPAIVRIVWPPAATVVTPARFPEMAAMLTRLFASASTTLAAMKASKQL